MSKDSHAPMQPNDLPTVLRWIAQHDGVIETRWGNQWERNERTDDVIEALFCRLRKVENKVAWYAGAAAAIGAFLGQLLTKL